MLIGALVLVCAGCGSSDEDTPAAGTGDTGSSTGAEPRTVEFTGYLLTAEGETRICEALAESYPPQCGGESYRVTGVQFSGVSLTEAQGVTWSDGQVTVVGVLSDDGETLMVSPKSGGGVPPPSGGGQPGSAPG